MFFFHNFSAARSTAWNATTSTKNMAQFLVEFELFEYNFYEVSYIFGIICSNFFHQSEDIDIIFAS